MRIERYEMDRTSTCIFTGRALRVKVRVDEVLAESARSAEVDTGIPVAGGTVRVGPIPPGAVSVRASIHDVPPDGYDRLDWSVELYQSRDGEDRRPARLMMPPRIPYPAT